MKQVFAIADNIVSPLGFDSEANWSALLRGTSALSAVNQTCVHLDAVHASLLPAERVAQHFSTIASPAQYTKLEQLYILSVLDAVRRSETDPTSERTLFVFSTTKGNIDLLTNTSKDQGKAERLRLPAMAKYITRFFGNPNEPVVISNACISGVFALMMGSFYIREGLYEKVIVAGGDIISPFTLSGFGSLHALSRGVCKPFDKNRDGINLGEACATVVLSSQPQSPSDIQIKGGATSNDANHISGPSKTGDGLAQAIGQALQYSGIPASEIGYVSAHGTATPYNDEMEAKALHSAGLADAPVNSLKGYVGHTLGAAGVLETILALWSLKKQLILASGGYREHGVSLPLRVVKENIRPVFNHCLKTASGFGGCNAALVLSKN